MMRPWERLRVEAALITIVVLWPEQAATNFRFRGSTGLGRRSLDQRKSLGERAPNQPRFLQSARQSADDFA